jgi:hypothetical protein
MALLLLSWIYIFFISLGIGILVQSLCKIKASLFYTLLLGLLGEMILIHFYAVFFPINELFYILNCSLTGFGWISHFRIWKHNVISSLCDWKKWKKSIQILSLVLTVLILMQTATKPYLIDNETYYVQAIKWFNEYGLVKGLANLHIFLGQGSGWHLVQSAFNFGYITHNLNGINGFLMLICTFFSLHHLNRFYNSKITMDLFLGLIPMVNLLFFQFLNIPSPDFPHFILAPIVFYLFYKNCVNYEGDFRLILAISVLLVLIKLTLVPILILPIVLLIKHKIWKEIPFFTILGIISLSAFTLKNYILSGYVFYPVDFLSSIFNPDWKIPYEVQQEFKPNKAINLAHLSHQNAQDLSTWEFFVEWLLEPGLRAVFNKLIIILLMIFPFYIYKNKTLFWLYIYALGQFFLLFFTTPQYRFFFPLIIGMLLYIFAKLFLNRPKYVLGFVSFWSLIPLISLMFSFNVEKFKNQQNSADFTYAFHWDNLIIPPDNSSSNFKYEILKEGNLEYHSPILEHQFYWLTGDGKLPTAQKLMIESFKKYLKVRPQMRTQNLKDGFYAEKIDE